MRVERALAGVTWRLLLGQRRWMAVIVCNGLPVLAAWMYALERGDVPPATGVDFTGGLLATMVLTGLLPLAGLVYGTTAVGQEIEDGTLGYLLATPTSRFRIVVSKVLVAAGATVVAVVPGVVLAGWIVLGEPLHPLIRGFVVGTAVAAVLYAGLFLALSLYTRRALLLGLLYVIAWEGALSRLFLGTRTFSVREYATAVTEVVAGIPLADILSSPLDSSTALWMSTVMLGVGVAIAVRRLNRIELLEEL